MTVERLRPLPDKPQLDRMYSTPHDHRQWSDHVLRMNVTLGMAQWLAGPVQKAADLSAGNGWLLDRIDAGERFYGDYAANNHGWRRGAIEDTVADLPKVDLFLCCETLEHLDDPPGVLAKLRTKTRLLVLSTPVDAWQDNNPEHLWAWDRDGVESLLNQAGFKVLAYAESDARPRIRASYKFGIWGCR